jgi:O-antigen ligase
MLLNGRLLERLDDIIAPLSSKVTHTVNTNTEDKDASISEKKEFKFSAGYRLEAWAAGKEVIMKTFPIGSGDDTRRYLSNYLNSESSLLSKMTFHHFHNQYIDSTAKHGILGVISLIILFGFPVVSWIRNKDESSLLFFITALVFFVAGLTDVPLNNKPTLTFYLTIFVIYAYYSAGSYTPKEEE